VQAKRIRPSIAGLYQVSSAFVDTLISVTLCLTLHRNIKNFNRETDSILRALIRLSVQSALPTALMAITGAALTFVFDFGAVNALYYNVPWAFFQLMTGLVRVRASVCWV